MVHILFDPSALASLKAALNDLDKEKEERVHAEGSLEAMGFYSVRLKLR